jgi:hypothetical protein
MSFFGSVQQAERPAAGEYVDGVWTEGELEAFSFIGTIQPLAGKDYDRLPEGRRERASYVVITKTQLRGIDEAGEVNADRVLAFGAWCEVLSVEPWQSGILPHYRAIIQRMNDQPVEEEEAP